MSKNMFKDLDKYLPHPSELGDLSEYDIYVLKNNITAGKIVKSDKLTDEESRMLADKLNDEWIETVVKPYAQAFHDFCEKYEIAVLEAECSLGVAPMEKYTMCKMMEMSLDKLLGRD